jgi:metal-sulfur cluster biosynthetic enzyme
LKKILAKNEINIRFYMLFCSSLFIANYCERWKGLTDLEDRVREEVGKLQDPETGMTFAEMRMITNVKEEGPGVIKVEFTPSSPFCPIAFKLASDLKDAAKNVFGVKRALIYCHGHAMEQQINEMTNK